MAAKTVAALTGGTSVTDVTLNGTATWTNGSQQHSGPVILKALGQDESSLDISLSDGEYAEIRDASSGAPGGEWKLGDKTTPFALHNCWTDAAWFFPPLYYLFAPSSSGVILSYLGTENKGGRVLYHLRAWRQESGQAPDISSMIAKLSSVDYFIDATSLLPVEMKFQTHPDTDANMSIPVKVTFSNYQDVNGVKVPFHVKKYVGGHVVLNITIDSATFNSGLQLSDFSIQ